MESLKEIHTNIDIHCKTQRNSEANLNLRNQNQSKKYQDIHSTQELNKDKGVQNEKKGSKLNHITNPIMVFQSQNANCSSHIKINSFMESLARYGSSSVL